MSGHENDITEQESQRRGSSGPEEITFLEGTILMIEHGYEYRQFMDKWSSWIDRGDVILIFQNEDLSSIDLGHIITMPWTETAREGMPSDGPFPPHAPDTIAGLGWRFLTKYIVRSKS